MDFTNAQLYLVQGEVNNGRANVLESIARFYHHIQTKILNSLDTLDKNIIRNVSTIEPYIKQQIALVDRNELPNGWTGDIILCHETYDPNRRTTNL